MDAPTSPAVTQYRCCVSNNVVVRAPSSRVGVYVQLRVRRLMLCLSARGGVEWWSGVRGDDVDILG